MMAEQTQPTPQAQALALEVCAIDRAPYKIEVKQVSLPGVKGLFIVLPGHAPLVSELEAGLLKVETVEGEPRSLAINGGIARVLNNQVLVLTRTAELDSDIDHERADASRKRAEERLKLQRDSIDVARAEASLRRALLRLQSAGKQPQAKG